MSLRLLSSRVTLMPPGATVTSTASIFAGGTILHQTKKISLIIDSSMETEAVEQGTGRRVHRARA